MRRARERDRGTGKGGSQEKVGKLVWAWCSWEAPTRGTRGPPGETRLAAMGRTSAKRSTARRVTRSKADWSLGWPTPGRFMAGWTTAGWPLDPLAVGLSSGRCRRSSWARAGNTLTFVNVRARMISRRKAVFFWLDSIRVRAMCGAHNLTGIPGNPAPEPRSARRTLARRALALGRSSLAKRSGARVRLLTGLVFRPFGASVAGAADPRLAPWAAFCRRSAAGFTVTAS